MNSLYEIRTLIAAIKGIKSKNSFLYNLLIGKEVEERTITFEIHTKDGQRIKAPLVGRRSQGVLVESTAFEKMVYSPPMIKIHTIASAENFLTQQFGSTIYGNPVENATKKLSEELVNLKTIATRTKYWALAQLLTTGILPVEEGRKGIKYGEFTPEVLTGTDRWDHADSDKIGYLRTKQIEQQKISGIVADTLIISPDVTEWLLKDKLVLETLKATGNSILSIDPKGLGDGTAYIGYIAELNLKIYSFIDWITNEAGMEETLLPAGTILGVKSKSFRIHYGAFPFRIKENEPSQLFIGKEAVRKVSLQGSEDDQLELHSAPLIIPNDAQGWFTTKVI